MNEQDIAARVLGAQDLARQEQAKLGKVEACDPPMGIATDPKLPAFHDVLCDAEQLIRQKPLWAKFVKGTPLENDVPVWIAEFALRLLQRERARRAIDSTRLQDYPVEGFYPPGTLEAAYAASAKVCPKCGTDEWDRITNRVAPGEVFNRCARCGNEWEAQ